MKDVLMLTMLLLSGSASGQVTHGKQETRVGKALTRTIEFGGVRRTFFVRLPSEFSADRVYWPLVVVHGGGGGALKNPKAIRIRHKANERNLPAIVICPEFKTADKQVSRFPVLGEAAFLEAVLKRVRAEFSLHPKILLTGYSMGGQFSHRFALAKPDLIQACAPFSAGTWSTPDGRLLIEGYGEVKDPKVFLSSPGNANTVTKRLRNLFDKRTADIAGLPAAEGARDVPFLVMCGTLDSRLSISREFADSLANAGFTVETGWPRTPHREENYEAEFEDYANRAISFFKKHIEAR